MQILKAIIIGAVFAIVIVVMPGHSIAQQTLGQSAPETKAEPNEPVKVKPAEPVEVVKTDGDVKIKLNFQDTPLQTVLEYLSETAGLTVVSDEPLFDGRMTVISRQPISLEQAVSLINSILKERGLTTVLNGKVLKVVTLENAKQESVPVFSGRDPDAVVASDDVVTYVVPVRYVTATALRQNLQSLIPEYASLEANEDGNALIITDTMANIKRMMKIVAALDTHMATVAEIRVFRLVNADATSAANMINSMFEQSQQGGARSSRTGRGGTQGGMNPMQMMMDRLGGGGGPGGGFGGFGGGRGGPGGGRGR
jgi:type II secretory pathway component GspD/PulD (secretin)